MFFLSAICQTDLSLPMDFDLQKVLGLFLEEVILPITD
jgi:hypothetical protein